MNNQQIVRVALIDYPKNVIHKPESLMLKLFFMKTAKELQSIIPEIRYEQPFNITMQSASNAQLLDEVYKYCQNGIGNIEYESLEKRSMHIGDEIKINDSYFIVTSEGFVQII